MFVEGGEISENNCDRSQIYIIPFRETGAIWYPLKVYVQAWKVLNVTEMAFALCSSSLIFVAFLRSMQFPYVQYVRTRNG